MSEPERLTHHDRHLPDIHDSLSHSDAGVEPLTEAVTDPIAGLYRIMKPCDK